VYKSESTVRKIIRDIGGIENFSDYREFGKLPGNVQIKFLDKIWAYLVKCRAGFRCEVTGREDATLNAHHLIGRTNYRLRWELENGICITAGVHNFGAHGSKTRQVEFEKRVKQLRGEDVYDRLLMLKNGETPNKYTVFLYFRELYKTYHYKEG
jgi:hypothetical protein